MITKELLDFIQDQRTKGISDETIEATLVSGGNWTKNDVAEAYATFKKPLLLLVVAWLFVAYSSLQLITMLPMLLSNMPRSGIDPWNLFFIAFLVSTLGVIVFKKQNILFKIACVLMLLFILYFIFFMTPLVWFINPKVFS